MYFQLKLLRIFSIAILVIFFSGCIEEKKVITQLKNDTNTTLEPEIKITSFSSIYMRDNYNIIEHYLFDWNNVPGNENYKLINFIKSKSNNWILEKMFTESPNWLDNAQVIKDDINNTIIVFDNINSVKLKLKNNQVSLYTDTRKYDISENVEIFKLVAKHENGKTNIYYPEIQHTTYNISENYYAIYELYIKNNNSNFKLDELHLINKDKIYNITMLEFSDYNLLDVMTDLKKENKLENKVLVSNQTIHGYVVFQVDSIYNNSYVLTYNKTPINFEKGFDALNKAEFFNYSIAFEIPPYSYCMTENLYKPKFDEPIGMYCDTWANWVNRSVFEEFKNSDLERMLKSDSNNIPLTKIVYALKVIPNKNITILPIKSNFYVIDDKGKEIINKSDRHIGGIAILNNGSYNFQSSKSIDIPYTNFTDATIVKISFEGTYGWSMAMRLSFNNQDVILNDDLDIIVARYYNIHFVS